jgi:AcrR family transcriptional regulator
MSRPVRRRTRTKAGYHHGDLRRALLDEALAMLRGTDPADLSLRELARRLGVTYGAPHHHFAEKDDLLAALAEAAFAEILERTLKRLERAGAIGERERLRIMAETYLEFARTEPSRYRVMFLPQLRDRKKFAKLHETGGRALSALADVFAAAGVDGERARSRAVGCWSTLHGFAVLANEGFLPESGEDLDALAREIVAQATRPGFRFDVHVDRDDRGSMT